MFTVCPKCTLTLVVTTVDLRAGQGYVRCGRCANVFNALIALREGEPSGTTSDTANRRLLETAPRPPVEPAFGSGVAMEPEPEPEPEPQTAAVTEIELSLETEAAPGEESSLEFDASATDVSEIFVPPPTEETDIGSGSYEAVVLGAEIQGEAEPEPFSEAPEPSHTDTIAAGEWSLLDDSDENQTTELSAESLPEEAPLEELSEDIAASEVANAGDPSWVQEMFAEAEAEATRTRTAELETLQATGAEDEEPAVVQAARDIKGVSASSGDTALEPLLGPQAVRRPAWQYITGFALLAVVLILQVLHHNRQNLVLNATLGPAVSKVYGWFHVTLVPRWDLNAYSVKQQGAEAEGNEGTRLRVRISVQNESERVQPLPLLRLTLQDRYGNAVGTRDLEPTEYLPPRAADLRLLEPDQRIDSELHVIDPGKAAINFEIDACLRSDTGTIGCASDARRPAAG